MNNINLERAVKLALLSASAVAVSMPAVAQEVDEEVVTIGSRIERVDLDAVSPVTVVNAEEFTLSGNINIEQKLAELPLTLPSFGPSSNNPGDGTARVNLRGLGTARTLVLVNGRRYIPSTQTGVVDLNTVPGTLIERVDVLTGGASAVYGSDALAGVVNFQLRDDFEGATITSLYDVSTEGDAERFNVDLTVGGNFADGKGNAVLYAGFINRKPLFQGDRDFSSFALTDSAPAGTEGQDSDTGIGGPLAAGGSSGIPGTRDFSGLTIFPGTDEEFVLGRFNPDGTGAPFVDPDDRFNYAPDNYLQLPQERFLLASFAHYDVNDRLRVFSELAFANNRVDQELAPTPAFLGTLEVNPDSEFFGDGVQAALDGIRSDTNGDGVVDDTDNAFLGFIGRRMVENGSRESLNNRDALRVLIGAEGDINSNWGYNAYYSYSRLQATELLNNDVSDSRFRQAVLVTDDGSACQDTSGGCAPLNIFGAGNISQAAIDFVNVGATNITSIEQQVLQATITGTLGSITSSAEPVGIAIGVEHREDESQFRPDTFLSAGDVLGFNAGDATVGGFDVNEVFAEIQIPLLSGLSGIENLSLYGAGRVSDYSNIGTVTSYAGAINYSPVDAVGLRVGYQRAVRAPNVAELFGGQSNGFPGATDPCSADFDGDLDATAVALCESVGGGVPAGQVGAFNQANTQIEGLFGGNPNLFEETSDTFTVGLVLQPTDGLDIQIDYFDISIDDAISVLGGSVDNVLSLCYLEIQDASSPFCQAIQRRGDGNVGLVSVQNANIGGFETSGVDFVVNWATDLGFGLFGNASTFALNTRATWLDAFDIQAVQELPDVDECAGNFGNTCGTPRNDLQVFTRATWSTGPLALSVLWRYLNEADDDSIDNAGVDPATLSVPSIDSINYVDFTASYDFTEAFRVNLGFRNIFDELPTFVGDAQQQANTFPELYDVIGRRVFVSASYAFR
ncbi:MAG: TonB-dependent receptor [Pseudomonadota bacterium]